MSLVKVGVGDAACAEGTTRARPASARNTRVIDSRLSARDYTLNLRPERARQRHAVAAAQDQFGVAGRGGMPLGNPVHPDDRGAVHARELLGIQLVLERAERL